MLNYVQLGISASMGMILGVGCVMLFNWRGNKKLQKEAIKDLDIVQEDLVQPIQQTPPATIVEPIVKQQPLPQQTLKECLYCGKMSQWDLCSVEHHQQWLTNHNRSIEGFDLPEKVEEADALKVNSVPSSSSKSKKKAKR